MPRRGCFGYVRAHHSPRSTRFRTKSSVFISTEAGAKGLNLQFCETLFNYDLPWNPQRIEQRIGRVHRYGQKRNVTIVSFLAARFIGEGLLDRFGRVGQVVRRQVDHAGFRSLLVLRFIPGIPFAVLNYGAGVAGVRLSDFVLATLFGMAPSVYVFAYCADSLFNGTLSEGDAVKRLVVVAALMISLVLLSTLIRRRARPTTESEG